MKTYVQNNTDRSNRELQNNINYFTNEQVTSDVASDSTHSSSPAACKSASKRNHLHSLKKTFSSQLMKLDKRYNISNHTSTDKQTHIQAKSIIIYMKLTGIKKNKNKTKALIRLKKMADRQSA